jgi:uncharacterized membrane protein YgcG
MFRAYGLSAAIAIAGVCHSAWAADVLAPQQPIYRFGTLRAMPEETAKERMIAWLKAQQKYNEAQFAKVWNQSGRPLLDRIAELITTAIPEAEAAFAEARATDDLPPLNTPEILRDSRLDPFIRTNLAAAYSQLLARRRAYEESLQACQGLEPELLVDPAAFYFYKAVAEHALGVLKPEYRNAGLNSITRLLDDVIDVPDRYRLVATLMYFDIQSWSKDPKDLSNIGRLMNNSGRRLDLARGGPQTQEIQKRIIFRLDEKIKELEKQQQGGGGGGGGGGSGGESPSGGGPPGGGTTQPSGPAGDSAIMGGSGEGKVDEKKLRHYAEVWGKLPAAERAKAIQEITRDLPPKFKPIIEEYFKSLNRINGFQP